jgi:membrane peptidoglycan carboxypeptidase
MRNVGGIRVTGGSYPASVWGAYMAEAMKGVPATSFPAPDLSKFGKASAVKLSKESGTNNRSEPRRRARPAATTTTVASSSDGEGDGGSGGNGSGDGNGGDKRSDG